MKMIWHPQKQTGYYVKGAFRKQQITFDSKNMPQIKDNTADEFRRSSWENLPENKVTRQRHRNYKRKK